MKKQLKPRLFEPSITEWTAPVFFAPKEDAKLRFCIDYPNLNKVAVKGTNRFPGMDECIDSFGDAKVSQRLMLAWDTER